MASIRCDEPLGVPASKAWAELRQVGNAHKLFAPIVADCSLEDDVRTVVFASGLSIRERIVDIDDRHRRLCYTVLGDRFEHHSASIEIVPVDDRNCRFVWISDFLPDSRADLVAPLVEQGCQALRSNLVKALHGGPDATCAEHG